MTVKLSVSAGHLAAALSEMRTWLDRNNYTPTWFGTTTQEPGTVLIRVDFEDESEGEAFRCAFDAAAPGIIAAVATDGLNNRETLGGKPCGSDRPSP